MMRLTEQEVKTAIEWYLVGKKAGMAEAENKAAS